MARASKGKCDIFLLVSCSFPLDLFPFNCCYSSLVSSSSSFLHSLFVRICQFATTLFDLLLYFFLIFSILLLFAFLVNSTHTNTMHKHEERQRFAKILIKTTIKYYHICFLSYTYSLFYCSLCCLIKLFL